MIKDLMNNQGMIKLFSENQKIHEKNILILRAAEKKGKCLIFWENPIKDNVILTDFKGGFHGTYR